MHLLEVKSRHRQRKQQPQKASLITYRSDRFLLSSLERLQSTTSLCGNDVAIYPISYFQH